MFFNSTSAGGSGICVNVFFTAPDSRPDTKKRPTDVET